MDVLREEISRSAILMVQADGDDDQEQRQFHVGYLDACVHLGAYLGVAPTESLRELTETAVEAARRAAR